MWEKEIIDIICIKKEELFLTDTRRVVDTSFFDAYCRERISGGGGGGKRAFTSVEEEEVEEVEEEEKESNFIHHTRRCGKKNTPQRDLC